MKIIEIDYGTGNRVGNTIYINRDLKRYMGLYEAVLAHELKHTGSFKWKDLSLDFINKDIRRVRGDWLRFLLKHPRAWINYSPFLRLGGEWTFDISILMVWIFMITLFTIGWVFT